MFHPRLFIPRSPQNITLQKYEVSNHQSSLFPGFSAQKARLPILVDHTRGRETLAYPNCWMASLPVSKSAEMMPMAANLGTTVEQWKHLRIGSLRDILTIYATRMEKMETKQNDHLHLLLLLIIIQEISPYGTLQNASPGHMANRPLFSS